MSMYELKFDSNRNWVGMIELSCDLENEIVRFSFPTEIDYLHLTLDQAESLSSILRTYVEKRHKHVLQRGMP